MTDKTRYVSLQKELELAIVAVAREVHTSVSSALMGEATTLDLGAILKPFAARLEQADRAIKAAALLHRRAWHPELADFLPEMEVGTYLPLGRDWAGKRYLRYGYLQDLDKALAPLRADDDSITDDHTYTLPDDPPGAGGSNG